MMKKNIYSIFTLLLLLTNSVTYAEINQYNIEILIFEDTSNRYLNSEQWPAVHHQQISTTEQPSSIPDTSSLDESKYKTQDKEIGYPVNNNVLNITHETSNNLDEYAAKINQSSRYKVLLHKSWQQTGLSDINAIDININSTKAKKEEHSNIDILEGNHKSIKKNSNSDTSSIDGTIKLILGRYLHIHTDLNYKRLKNSAILYKNLFSEFKIQSQRKMRSNELHYLDHPLVGTLIIVTPIQRDKQI